jgi:hypothetical protein
MIAAQNFTTTELEPDRRRINRTDVSISAKIGFRDKQPIACTIRNVSPMGALLEFSTDIVLPENFRIVVASKIFTADCEVRHHKGRFAGVMFVSSRAEALAAFG